MERPCWSYYRAPCRPFATGCRQCGAPIPDRRAYCSDQCSEEFGIEHFWTTANAEAIRRAQPFGPANKEDNGRYAYRPWRGAPICRGCGKSCGWLENARAYTVQREAEVNHIVPLEGKRPSFGCVHHQENLVVLCHRCHVEVTKAQRQARKARKVAGTVTAESAKLTVRREPEARSTRAPSETLF